MSDEVADGLEIDLANAPGAIKQQHDVGLRCSVTLSVCTETVVVVGWAVVGGVRHLVHNRHNVFKVLLCEGKVRKSQRKYIKRREEYITKTQKADLHYKTQIIHTPNTLCNLCPCLKFKFHMSQCRL